MPGWLLTCRGMNQFGSKCAYYQAYTPDPAQAASDRLRTQKAADLLFLHLMVLVVPLLAQWWQRMSMTH